MRVLVTGGAGFVGSHIVDLLVSGGHEVRSLERLHPAPSPTRSYRYSIDGGLPVTDNRGRFTVEPRPHGAMIVWESSFRAVDPAGEDEFSGMWAVMLPIVLGNLEALIEDGSGAGRRSRTAKDPESR